MGIVACHRYLFVFRVRQRELTRNIPFRFRVIIEMLKPEKPDSATTLKGLDYVDVPGLSKRDYRLSFFAHKEGTFSAKVRSYYSTRHTVRRPEVPTDIHSNAN